MNRICQIDFETLGEDLKSRGATAYGADWETMILCLSYQINDNPIRTWFPSEEPVPEDLLTAAADPGTTFASFNVRFEKAIWRKLVGRYGYGLAAIPDERWHDIAAVCAHKALPITLEYSAAVLDIHAQKDVDASRYVVGLSKAGAEAPDLPRVARYCEQDVRTQIAVHNEVGELCPRERKIWLLDQKINDRGILIDLPFVELALQVVDKIVPPLMKELTALTNVNHREYQRTGRGVKKETKQTRGLTVGQRGQLQKWLAFKGLELPDMRAETLDRALLRTDLSPEVRRALEIRSDVSSTSIKKYDAMLAGVCEDGRARDLIVYHAASTGRWAGRRINPLNFPRPIVKADPEELVAAIMTEDPVLIEAKYGNVFDALATGLRHAIIAPPGKKLVVGDFAGIEARIVLALAGQHDKCDLMASGVDVYADMAATIYHRPINKTDNPVERQVGKNAVLGCGYQTGAKTFQEKFAPDMPLEECEKVIRAYREKWAPAVPKLWRVMGETSLATVQDGQTRECYGVRWEMNGRWLNAHVPGGGTLWFFEPRVALRKMPWSTPENPDMRPAWSYLRTEDSKRTRKDMFGGLITQNIVESLARDLLVRAIVKAEKAGMPVVLCVHDELVCEAESDRSKELEEIMCGRPPWAIKMQVPIAAEVWAGGRYRK